MWKNIKKLFLCMMVLSITSNLSFAQQEPNNAITLEALPKATKGFPLVIKVTFKGPQKVRNFSIFDYGIPITVHLIAKTDGNEYIIQSHTIGTTYVVREGGGQIDLPEPSIDIPDGQKLMMMFDLWSLLARTDLDTALCDVPAEKYNLSIELDSQDLKAISRNRLNEEQIKELRTRGVRAGALMIPKIKSNVIDLELIEPTDKEKQYIEKTRVLGNTMGSVINKVGVNWAKLLRNVTIFPENDISEFTQISKDQLSFHKLISDVNIVDEKSRNKSIKDVNSASLPEFFESERQLLLLELKGNPEKERLELLKKYPQLRGIVEKLDSGNKLFLIYKNQRYQ